MASLFLSHSSKDDELIGRLAARLRERQYVSFFLDHDPESGIQAGRRWEDELYSKLRSSQAVIFVASEDSKRSRWCFAELVVARSIRKPIIPISVGGARLDLLDDLQWIDWSEGELGLERLWAALASLDVEALPALDPNRPPYPGLEAFDEKDAEIFFGRDAEIDELLNLLHPPRALEPRRFVAVSGPSGTGKSSLVRAGLIPRLLSRKDWVALRPFIAGDDPLGELARALKQAAEEDTDWREIRRRIEDDPTELAARAENLAAGLDTSRSQVLVVVDQAEELVRLADDVRLKFLGVLAQAQSASSRLWVVITIRSDSLVAALERSPVTSALVATMLVLPLDRTRLAEVIRGPAERTGIELEGAVVDRMVSETEGGDALPLLAYTLRELYERSLPGRQITDALYDAVGGVLGALKDRADRLLGQLERFGDGRLVLPTLVQLVALTPLGEATRRRVRLDEFDDEQEVVLRAFVDERLLKTSQATDGSVVVEAVHEALFRVWIPLAQAIKQSEEELRARSELEQLAKEWEARERLSSYLIGEDRLERAQRFLATQPIGRPDLALIREYVQSSQDHQDRREERMRSLTEEARASRVRAELQAQADEVEKALAGHRPIQGLLLAVQTLHRNLEELPGEVVGAVQSGLRNALEHARERNVLIGHYSTVTAVATSPSSAMLASAGNDATVRLWDLEGNPVNRPLQGPDDHVLAVAFCGDGRILASGGGDGKLRLWDVDGELLWEAAGHLDSITSVALSGDGRWVVTGSDDRTVRVWASTGEAVGRPFEAHHEFVSSVSLSADGRVIASASGDGTIGLWEREPPRLLRQIRSPEPVVLTCVAQSPDGERLASGGADGQLLLIDLDGTVLAHFKAHEQWISSVAFSPDGRRIASGGADGSVRVWDSVGTPLGPPLYGHGEVVTSVAFSADGQVLASGGADATVRLWDVQGLLLSRFKAHRSNANGLAFASAGTVIATAGADRRLCLWDLRGNLIAEQEQHENFVHALASSLDGKLLASGDANGMLVIWDGSGTPVAGPIQAHPRTIASLAFSPDGTIASGSDDGTVRLWDASGTPLASISSGADSVFAVAFSPDAKTIAGGSNDGTVRLWEANGTLLTTFAAGTDSVFAVAFSPDGTLAAAGDDGIVRRWAPSGASLQAIDNHVSDVYSVAFSPDGKTIAAGGGDGTVGLWDLEGVRIGPAMGGADGAVAMVRFSPDGAVLAAATASGHVGLWLADDWKRWLDLACRRLRSHPVLREPSNDAARTSFETCARHVGGDPEDPHPVEPRPA